MAAQPDPAVEWISVAQWAKECDIRSQTARYRINRVGIPLVEGKVQRGEANALWAAKGSPKFSNNRFGKGRAAGPPTAINDGQRPVLTTIDGGRQQRSLADIELEQQEIKLAMEKVKLAERVGQLWPAEEVKLHVAGMIVEARETLFHLPNEMADRLVGKTPQEIKKILQKAIDGVLAKLSEYKPKK